MRVRLMMTDSVSGPEPSVSDGALDSIALDVFRANRDVRSGREMSLPGSPGRAQEGTSE